MTERSELDRQIDEILLELELKKTGAGDPPPKRLEARVKRRGPPPALRVRAKSPVTCSGRSRKQSRNALRCRTICQPRLPCPRNRQKSSPRRSRLRSRRWWLHPKKEKRGL